MLLACLWPCLCPGAVGCGSSESRAYGIQRTPTLAPRRATPFAQLQGKERLLSCGPAAAITAVTAIITIVVQLLLKHYVAFPPTSRCYRSTNNASHVRLITIWLIWSVFLPGSRATLATANNVSDTLASVEARGLKQMRGDSVLFPTETNLPWILGGIIMVTIFGLACLMMPGLGGGSRTENFN